MKCLLRNGKYSFYYNEKEYEKDRYDQWLNNMPVFVNADNSMSIRDEFLINSMDYWNDIYTANIKYDHDVTFTGVLSLYGNGYMHLLSSIDVDEHTNEYSLQKTKELNDCYIHDYVSNKEVNIVDNLNILDEP